MATVRDLYDVLGVTRDASTQDIKAAYRRLAREHHPDVNGDPAAEERFKEIAGAYEILSDPEKRQRYDAFGTSGGPQGGFTDIQDIFDMFFGGGFTAPSRPGRSSRSRSQHGEDLGVRVTLSFKEAAFGVRRDLTIDRLTGCDTCGGNGAAPGTAPIACRGCGGAGQVQAVRRTIFGTVMTAAPCSTCRGGGMEIPDKCESCFGEGRRREPGTVAVDIPAGVDDGMELRIPSQGHAGVNGGPSGDLYAQISVEPSPELERREHDLFTVLDISITQAALGAQVDVEGLDDVERITVQPGTESGTVLRVKGKGVPNLNRRGRGDLFVTLHVVTPPKLSREERQLLERFASLRGEASPTDAVRGSLRRPQF